MVAEIVQDEGHDVSVAQDFRAAQGMLRSVLHPVVVVFVYAAYVGDVVQQAEQVQALAAAIGTLRRYAYMQINWWCDPLPPALQVLAEQVIMRRSTIIQAKPPGSPTGVGN